MSERTRARPYAQAAFEVAVASGMQAAWQQVLIALAQAAETPALAQVVMDPRYSVSESVDLLTGVVTDSLKLSNENVSFDDSMANFIYQIVENSAFSSLPVILDLWHEASMEAEQSHTYTVVSTQPMPGEAQQRLRSWLAEKKQHHCEVSFTVDQSLGGGFYIRSGDWVLDNTFAGRLQRLAQSISQ